MTSLWLNLLTPEQTGVFADKIFRYILLKKIVYLWTIFHAIFWTKAGLVYWYVYAWVALGELREEGLNRERECLETFKHQRCIQYV